LDGLGPAREHVTVRVWLGFQFQAMATVATPVVSVASGAGVGATKETIGPGLPGGAAVAAAMLTTSRATVPQATSAARRVVMRDMARLLPPQRGVDPSPGAIPAP
jgi:hypothetical protein